MAVGDALPFALGGGPPPAPPDPRAWSTFDPNLRIDVYPGEMGTNIVTIVHLPTGMQEACGQTTSEALNRATAMTRLRRRVL